MGFFLVAKGALCAPPPCRTLYVDQNHPLSADDEERDGTDPNRPYKTITFALDRADSCDEVWVYPGIYEENVESEDPDTKLIAKPSPGRHNVIIRPPLPGPGVYVDSSSFTLEGFVVEGAFGGPGIRFQNVAGGVARGNVVRGGSGAGILVKNSSYITLENNTVHHNGTMGIEYKRDGGGGQVVNNRVYANGGWGIFIEPQPAAQGYRVEFNTVDQNGAGGINVVGVDGASGMILHNIITRHPTFGLKVRQPQGTRVQFQAGYNCFFANAAGNELDGTLPLGGDVFGDPLYVHPQREDGYQLSHRDIQGVDSPCLDAGMVLAREARAEGSTATDGGIDEGVVDLGYHTPGRAFPLKVVLKRAELRFNREGEDALTLKGRIRLAPESDGVDPEAERVRITSGPFSQVLPVGSVERHGSGWRYEKGEAKGEGKREGEGEEFGVTEFSLDQKGYFTITIEGAKLPNRESAELELTIGNDKGSTTKVYNQGVLKAR